MFQKQAMKKTFIVLSCDNDSIALAHDGWPLSNVITQLLEKQALMYSTVNAACRLISLA
jgi:hypothetical protein